MLSAINHAESTGEIAKSYIESEYLGRLLTWIQTEMGVMPEWASNHIKATKELESILSEYQKKGEVPPIKLTQSVETSHELVRLLSDKVDKLAFKEAIKNIQVTTPGSSGLLSDSSSDAIPKFTLEWQINLGLMLNAYNTAKSDSVKKEIGFLILNYLAKAAPICFSRFPMS